MKALKHIFLLLIIFCFGCASSSTKNVNPGFQHFRISIEQDNSIKDTSNHVVQLEKKPFTIIVSLPAADSVFINASLKPASYIATLEGEPVDSISGFSKPAMDEELFNKDETIYISQNSPNFWYYTSSNDHRFSEIIEKSGIYLCRRNISNITLSDENKKISISEIPEKALYLVFMKLEWNKDFSKKIEIKRDYLKIEFENNRELSSYETPHIKIKKSTTVN